MRAVVEGVDRLLANLLLEGGRDRVLHEHRRALDVADEGALAPVRDRRPALAAVLQLAARLVLVLEDPPQPRADEYALRAALVGQIIVGRHARQALRRRRVAVWRRRQPQHVHLVQVDVSHVDALTVRADATEPSGSVDGHYHSGLAQECEDLHLLRLRLA